MNYPNAVIGLGGSIRRFVKDPLVMECEFALEPEQAEPQCPSLKVTFENAVPEWWLVVMMATISSPPRERKRGAKPGH